MPGICCSMLVRTTKILLLLLLACTLLFLFSHFTPPTVVPHHLSHNTPPQTVPTAHHKTHCYILVMILSTPANARNRAILRENSYLGYQWFYNSTRVRSRHLFVLGSSGDGEVDRKVKEEAQYFGDIAVGTFHDSYETLSEKVVWGFEHVLRNYEFVFCVKVDEDSFVNLSYLAGYLSTVPRDMLPSFYAGKPRQGNLAVPRTGKFKVEKWANNEITEYVQYNLGGGYILSRESMKMILMAHHAGSVEPILWEDVYIGMLAYLVDIEPTRIYHYYVSKFYPFCTDDKTILLHHTLPELQARMLNYYHKHGYYCPKNQTEAHVVNLIKSYEMVNWLEY